MDQKELKAKINALAQGTLKRTPTVPDSETRELTELLVDGIAVVGEMFLDIKRIADAAESTIAEAWSAPVGARQRVSRVLASKEALRKLGGPQVTDGPEERDENQRSRQLWVNENWPAFQDEAAELLAAVRDTGR